MGFELNQEVEWSSQANGSTTTKRGKVVAIVSADSCVLAVDLKRLLGEDYQRRFDRSAIGWGDKRNHESYLVAVPGKTSKSKSKLYWPRVSKLKAVGE